MNTGVKRIAALCSASIFGLTGTTLYAQESSTVAAEAIDAFDADPSPGNDFGEEIIVTAQRRDESLSKTPISISYVSADTLAKAQIVNENDLRLAVPGLQVRSGSNSNQINYAIRGQTQDPFSNVRPGVLPYINDVQIGGVGGASAFYDLQSVQVLKGPQGTLFGRSATGGAVLFTTAKPTEQFEGYVSGLYGNKDAAKIEGAINVPLLGESLTSRTAAFYRRRDGLQFNLFDGLRDGRQEQYGGRFSLSAKIGPSVKNELVVDYLRSDSENMSAVISGLMPFTGVGSPFVPAELLYAGTATAGSALVGQCTLQAFVGVPGDCPPVAPFVEGFYTSYFADPSHPQIGLQGVLDDQNARGPYVIDSDSANIFRTRNLIISNTTEIDVSEYLTFKNIVGFTKIRSFVNQENDGTPYSIASSPIASLDVAGGQGQRNYSRQFSNEMQLLGTVFDGQLDYVFGGYFSDETNRIRQRSAFFDILFGGLSALAVFDTQNKTYAGYSQATYRFGDTGWGVTIGARYTSEKVSISVLPGDSNRVALGEAPPPLFDYDQSATYNRLSWTIGIQNQITPDVLLYAASRRAFKSGGYNGLVPPKIGGGEVGGNGFEAERITDAEIGAKFKGVLGSMPARANLALYNGWIKDSQRVAFAAINGSPIAVTVNVPTGTTRGAEFDFELSPADWISFGGAANYTKATFGSDPVMVNGQLQVFDQVPDTPRFSGSFYTDFSMPISSRRAIFVHADIYHQAKTFTSPRSANSNGTVIPSYELVNLRGGIEDSDGNWSITANVKNLFNKRHFVGGLAAGEIFQVNMLIPGEPRMFTLEARIRF